MAFGPAPCPCGQHQGNCPVVGDMWSLWSNARQNAGRLTEDAGETLLKEIAMLRIERKGGLGTPEHRLSTLLDELQKRFPKVHSPLSSSPPEPYFLAAIDEVMKSWSTEEALQLAGWERLFEKMVGWRGSTITGAPLMPDGDLPQDPAFVAFHIDGLNQVLNQYRNAVHQFLGNGADEERWPSGVRDLTALQALADNEDPTARKRRARAISDALGIEDESTTKQIEAIERLKAAVPKSTT